MRGQAPQNPAKILRDRRGLPSHIRRGQGGFLNQDAKYWVALSTNHKIGGRTFLKLFRRFKKLEKIWQSNNKDLTQAGLDINQIEAVKEVIASKNPDQEIEKLKKLKIDVLILPDKEYPKNLLKLPDPPGILYLKGKIIPEDGLAIAVVGSRKYSPYGQRATEELIGPIAAAKISIISGLALGIDSNAHEVALSVGGRTIAVLGCGLDQIYPTANIRLADKILAADGAIISEFPLGTPAWRSNFPIRNRIIAGLSLGTVVIEAAPDSGSLLTATASIEYNREVFAVPGEIFSETSKGTNRLIQMGAKLVSSPHDILEELSLSKRCLQIKAQEILPDSKEEEILLKLLRQPVLIDHLVVQSKLTTALVNSTLIEMEMKGKIRNMGGTRFVINGKLIK